MNKTKFLIGTLLGAGWFYLVSRAAGGAPKKLVAGDATWSDYKTFDTMRVFGQSDGGQGHSLKFELPTQVEVDGMKSRIEWGGTYTPELVELVALGDGGAFNPRISVRTGIIDRAIGFKLASEDEEATLSRIVEIIETDRQSRTSVRETIEIEYGTFEAGGKLSDLGGEEAYLAREFTDAFFTNVHGGKQRAGRLKGYAMYFYSPLVRDYVQLQALAEAADKESVLPMLIDALQNIRVSE